MKKLLFLILFSIAFLLCACNFSYEKAKGNEQTMSKIKVENFKMSDYNSHIENYTENKNIGEVKTSEIAIEKAEKLWKEYSWEQNFYELPEKLDFKVYYDKEKACWLITGFTATIKNPDGSLSVTLASSPNAIIKKDGKVLAVWLDMEG